MKWFCSFGVYFSLIWSLAAQIELGIQLERDQYLLYEPIPVKMVVRNNSGSPLQLSGPWLSFLVTKSDGHGVRADNPLDSEPQKFEPGEQKTFTANITPLYAIRDSGQYLVQGVVDVQGTQYVSKTVALNVANGLRIWKESKPIQGVQRVYSLIRFSPTSTATLLFVRVDEPDQNRVFSTLPLGEVVTYLEPETKFDREGNLHILHPQGKGFFRYSRISGSGKLLNQVDYNSSNQSRPSLVSSEEGMIMVTGGFSTKDQPKRSKLSQGQKSISSSEIEAMKEKPTKK